jgi:UDP-glucose-4-epimerase GalE
MRLLITGGAGYVGSHVAKALRQAGHEVITFDNLSTGHEWAVKWGPLERGDLRDSERLREVFARYQIDAVLHFAALAYVGESMREPYLYFDNNVAGTLCLLRAMSRASVRFLVFSSTCAVYGAPQVVPITESSLLAPCNPYGESKRIIEQMLQWGGTCNGLRWVALRYFNAAGCDPECETGELHQPETHLIPSLLNSVLVGTQPCPIYGADYPTPDGTCVRDYVHVTDLAEAHLRALGYLVKGGESRSMNLGSGRGFSVLEVVKGVGTVTGRSAQVRVESRRPGDPPVLVSGIDMASRLLRWQPVHSSLEEILSTAWAWHRKSAMQLGTYA